MVRAFDAAGNSGDSGTVQVTVNNPTAGSGDIVLYAADATVIRGGWQRQNDTAAAGGAVMRHPNAGAAKRTTALASPVDYFELTFQAQANVPYHLWIRSKADDDYWANDSVFVQFSGSTAYAIATTAATEMNLEDCSGCGVTGWGWQDNGWGVGVIGSEHRVQHVGDSDDSYPDSRGRSLDRSDRSVADAVPDAVARAPEERLDHLSAIGRRYDSARHAGTRDLDHCAGR